MTDDELDAIELFAKQGAMSGAAEVLRLTSLLRSAREALKAERDGCDKWAAAWESSVIYPECIDVDDLRECGIAHDARRAAGKMTEPT